MMKNNILQPKAEAPMQTTAVAELSKVFMGLLRLIHAIIEKAEE